MARKGARDILYSLEKEGDMNFTELRNLIGSPTTTSQRLDELTELELVKRDVQDDKFRSVKYSLTGEGSRIIELVREIEDII